jgi:hypothetical protein
MRFAYGEIHYAIHEMVFRCLDTFVLYVFEPPNRKAQPRAAFGNDMGRTGTHFLLPDSKNGTITARRLQRDVRRQLSDLLA